MNRYKVIIVDDEQLGIDVLVNYLERFSQFELLETFTNPLDTLKYIASNNIDLVFTDIAMPDISGTELVQLTNNKTKFVMVTSYSEYAIESFELDVVDYLLKPVSLERFTKTIERFDKQCQEVKTAPLVPDPSFFIKEGDEYIKVLVHDIDYIEGMKDYSKIVCGNNYYMALKSLKSIENSLLDYGFLRIHKSFIVPLRKIVQYNGRCVLIDKHEVPVGNSYRNSLKQFFMDNKL